VAATRGAVREPITTAYFGPPGSDQVLVISVPLAGDGTNGTSFSALDTLCNQALSATLGKVPGVTWAVGGLTDYHVFIPSRIRELRNGGATSREAVTGGIASSAGVVTSAAAIMVAVFSIFATLSVVEFKVFGVTMAAAVLLDATIVRGVLLPAGLALLGDRAWWWPGRQGSPARRQGGIVIPGYSAQLTGDRQR
jgi:uncharacterized membrane protein YdfJ with MMPL/SSD domain